MRLAFVVADVRAQDPTWGTVYLARAAARAGHEVVFVGVDDLTLGQGDRITALARRPDGPGASNEAFAAALAATAAASATEEVDLRSFDVVFLRYHPRREGKGAAAPTVDFGWRLTLAGVLVVNDPVGMQQAGGRMYLSDLPPEIRPRTLITRDPAKIKAFLKSLNASAVLKPLDDKHRGEDTVFYVTRGQVKNLNQIIDVVRKTGYVVAQEFVPQAREGEKRLLLLGGDPIRVGRRVAIYRRMRGEDGCTMRRRAELGAAERRVVDLLRPKLVADGLYFVSVDLAGGKVLGVNVHTPGGLHANQVLYGIDVAEFVVRDLERRVALRARHPSAQGV